MSDDYFTITIENNKPIIIDKEGRDAEKTIAEITQSYLLFKQFTQLYTVVFFCYIAYGIISFMMGESINIKNILGTIIFGFGLGVSYMFLAEKEIFKGHYLRGFGDAKMQLKDKMAKLEIETLKHRLAMEKVEKESKLHFTHNKEMEMEA